MNTSVRVENIPYTCLICVQIDKFKEYHTEPSLSWQAGGWLVKHLASKPGGLGFKSVGENWFLDSTQ